MITIGIDPVAFTIGSLSIRWYGVMIALAIAVVLFWMLWQVRKGASISNDTLMTAALVGIPSGVVLSKLLHVIDRLDFYSQNPGQILSGSGLTIYGAVLGATLGVWLYSKFGNFRFGYFADLVAPAVILGQAIGRVGCTINGCCYGKLTSLPWGLVYTHPDALAPLGIATHPVVVYEILFLLPLFGVISRLKGKLAPEGSLFLVYLGFYSLWRVLADFLREGTPFLFGLHQAQVVGIMILAFVVATLAYRSHWVKVGVEA